MGVPLDYSEEFLNEVAKILASGKHPDPEQVKYFEEWNHFICNHDTGSYPLIDLYTTHLEPMELWVTKILTSENCTETTRKTLALSNIYWKVIYPLVSDAQAGEGTLLTVVQNAENIIPYSCGICVCMSSPEEYFQDRLNQLFESILYHPNCTDAVRAAIESRQ